MADDAGPPPDDSLREPRADGLERFYDVVIVGTGLVEAMLSAYVPHTHAYHLDALARSIVPDV